MERYRLVVEPTRIPVPGGKLIEELFGAVNTGTSAFSLAHMVAPGGWGEPAQTPDFGELTIMVRGAMKVEIDDHEIVVRAGQAFWVEGGVRVRYSNPFDEESEYYAVCMPAFTPDAAHRDPDDGGPDFESAEGAGREKGSSVGTDEAAEKPVETE